MQSMPRSCRRSEAALIASLRQDDKRLYPPRHTLIGGGRHTFTRRPRDAYSSARGKAERERARLAVERSKRLA